MTKTNWEKEFDELLDYQLKSHPVDVLGLGENGANQMLQGKIKSFIHSLLVSDRQRMREEIEKMKKEQLDKSNPDNYEACYAIGGFNDALNKILKLLE